MERLSRRKAITVIVAGGIATAAVYEGWQIFKTPEKKPAITVPVTPDATEKTPLAQQKQFLTEIHKQLFAPKIRNNIGLFINQPGEITIGGIFTYKQILLALKTTYNPNDLTTGSAEAIIFDPAAQTGFTITSFLQNNINTPAQPTSSFFVQREEVSHYSEDEFIKKLDLNPYNNPTPVSDIGKELLTIHMATFSQDKTQQGITHPQQGITALTSISHQAREARLVEAENHFVTLEKNTPSQ